MVGVPDYKDVKDTVGDSIALGCFGAPTVITITTVRGCTS
jgi:hypothetical protein